MAIVDVIRPRLLVEVGTGTGDSYCGFCQAVAVLGLKTRCLAFDAWDAEAGARDERSPPDIEDLVHHHDPLYGSFSRLVRGTSEDALRDVGDGTVDLLSLAGVRSVAELQHALGTWRRKLSPSAIVLIFGTNVRKKGDELALAWDELAVQHPHFVFHHGNGLGVIAFGDVPEAARLLMDGTEATSGGVRDLYETLGLGVERERQLRCALRELDVMHTRAAEFDGARGDFAALASNVDRLDAEVVRLGQELERRRGELEASRAAAAEMGRAMTDLGIAAIEQQRAMADLGNAVIEQQRAMAHAHSDAAQVRAQLCTEKTRAERIRGDLETVVRSRSWRAIMAYRSARDRVLNRR